MTVLPINIDLHVPRLVAEKYKNKIIFFSDGSVCCTRLCCLSRWVHRNNDFSWIRSTILSLCSTDFCSIGCLAMLTISLTLNWAGPSLPKLLHEESSGNDENEIKITSEEGSWIVSMTILAAVFGPLFSTFLVDRIGRKWSLGGVVIIMSISWVIVGIARTVVLLTIGRFIGGLAVGAGFPLTAMYLGEIAEDRIRGALGSVLTVALVLGQVLIFSVGPWISRPMLSLFSASPLIIFLLGFPWIPETPHYWLMKGNIARSIFYY